MPVSTEKISDAFADWKGVHFSAVVGAGLLAAFGCIDLVTGNLVGLYSIALAWVIGSVEGYAPPEEDEEDTGLARVPFFKHLENPLYRGIFYFVASLPCFVGLSALGAVVVDVAALRCILSCAPKEADVETGEAGESLVE